MEQDELAAIKGVYYEEDQDEEEEDDEKTIYLKLHQFILIHQIQI